jgi:protein gp37
MNWAHRWNGGNRDKNSVPPGSKIFTCSYSDFFLPEADPWRDEAWQIIKATPQFIYIILTKRPEKIKNRLPADWGEGYANVWLLVSTENQAMYDLRIRELINIPAAVRGISAEPLLSPIYLHYSQYLDWVITGGESGSGARKSEPVWFSNIIDHCNIYMIPIFHKQNGGTKKIAGAWGGRVFNGRTYDQFPEVE